MLHHLALTLELVLHHLALTLELFITLDTW